MSWLWQPLPAAQAGSAPPAGTVFNPLTGRGAAAAQPLGFAMHLGDYDAASVIYAYFATYRPSTGAAYTLAGTPVIRVYKDGSTTQHTTTYSVTADFDSITGLNYFTIDTSADGTFFAAGSNFTCVLEAGTVDSVSVVGSVVATFTLRKSAALKPTTAGRTLVVDANGLADANTVKLGPTGSGTAQTARDIGASVLLSSGTGTGQLDFTSGVVKSNLAQILGTALTETSGLIAAGFKKFFNVATPTGTVNSLPDAVPGAAGGVFIAGTNAATAVTTALTANITGNLSGSVGSVTGLTAADVGAIKTKTDYLPSATAGAAGGVFIAGTNAATTVTTALTTTFTGNLTGNVGGNVTGSVGSVATNGISAASLASDAGDEIADAVLKRDWTSVTGEAARSALNALRFLRNKWSISAGTLTVTKEDDSTPAFTSALTTDGSAQAVTASDPS